MNITVLIENRVSLSGLKAEHGLSYLIATEGETLLFDMGASNQFLLNAGELGVDLSKIKVAAISHGHNDHTGGLASFMEVNNSSSIYLKKEVVSLKFKNERSIGFDPKINTKPERFVFVDKVTEILPKVFIFPNTSMLHPEDQCKSQFYAVVKGKLIPDNFDDELFLVLLSEDSISILSSCSHNGITNMVETARKHFNLPVKYIIGGFHLKDSDNSVSTHIADYFNSIKAEAIYTGHCTGVNAFAELKRMCKSTITYLETGLKLTI